MIHLNHLLHATDTNNTSFARRSTTKRTTYEIWESKPTSKKPPLKSMTCRIKQPQEKLPVNLLGILSHLKLSDFRFVILASCHFSSLIFHDCSLKFSKQKVSYFEPFQSQPKGI